MLLVNNYIIWLLLKKRLYMAKMNLNIEILDEENKPLADNFTVARACVKALWTSEVKDPSDKLTFYNIGKKINDARLEDKETELSVTEMKAVLDAVESMNYPPIIYGQIIKQLNND